MLIAIVSVDNYPRVIGVLIIAGRARQVKTDHVATSVLENR